MENSFLISNHYVVMT